MTRKKGFLLDYNKIERDVWALTEPLAAACGAELVDVEYVKEAGAWYLRIYIDREQPVDHALCERVSEAVGAALDHADPIPGSYYLEISSPGLERPLKREEDFRRFAGRQVLVKLYAPRDGVKEFSGQLQGLEAEDLLVLSGEEALRFPLEQVAHVRLKVDF